MNFITEVEEKEQSILIVDPKSKELAHRLAQEMKKHGARMYFSHRMPASLERYDHIFMIDELLPAHYKKPPNQGILLLLISKKRTTKIHHVPDAKVIYLGTRDIIEDELDKILWFAFSNTKETYLNLRSDKEDVHEQHANDTKKRSPEQKSKKRKKLYIIIFAAIFLLIHLALFPFIGLSSLYARRASQELKKEQIDKAKKMVAKGKNAHAIASFFYVLTRPTYLFLSLAPSVDNLIDISGRSHEIIHTSLSLYESGREIMQLILKKDKSVSEKEFLILKIEAVTQQVDDTENNLELVVAKLPTSGENLKSIKKELEEALELIQQLKNILPLAPSILAEAEEKKYLLLFANNMELRPGGGFIGSFGILTMKDFTLENLEVFDVYDADGQLTIHIEPPVPIRDHLNQPNFFLRDSAFLPDHAKNYQQAKLFLEEEMGLADFAGGAVITATGIQNILGAFDTISLPDFNETITKDNFYIKAQVYAEDDFFPGSIKKRSFLGSLARQLIINLENASPARLASTMKKSLDEKQIAISFEEEHIAKVMDSFYWSGKTIIPTCPGRYKDCLIDYLFPYDANLGVNKANFFVSRFISHHIKIDSDGKVSNSLSISLKNDSPNSVFPGGTYKNYFQLLLPKNAVIRRISKNGTNIEAYDETVDVVKTVGFLLEVKPQSTALVKLEYELEEKLPKGKYLYQLIIQKQIGSKNSDVHLEVELPNSIKTTKQNFSPLVKGNHIFYNTSLSADKIFLLEFERK